MQNKAFSKILIIVIILFVVGILTLFYITGVKNPEIQPTPTPTPTSTPDETADWQIYRNEVYKYEFKYPSELMPTENIQIETAKWFSLWFPEGNTPDIAKEIDLNVVNNSDKKSLRSILGYESTECSIEAEENAFTRISCEMNNKTMRIIGSAFTKDNNVYTVGLVIISSEDLSNVDFSNEIETYNLILSTFKFIEGEATKPPTTQDIQNKTKDGKVMADMNLVAAATEIYYSEKGSYINLDSNEDIKNLCNEIRNEIGRWPGFIMRADAYCVDIVLTDGKTRYCVDFQGRRGENLGCSHTELICIQH